MAGFNLQGTIGYEPDYPNDQRIADTAVKWLRTEKQQAVAVVSDCQLRQSARQGISSGPVRNSPGTTISSRADNLYAGHLLFDRHRQWRAADPASAMFSPTRLLRLSGRAAQLGVGRPLQAEKRRRIISPVSFRAGLGDASDDPSEQAFKISAYRNPRSSRRAESTLASARRRSAIGGAGSIATPDARDRG